MISLSAPGVLELLEVIFGLLDHHVYFQRQAGLRSYGLHDDRTKRDRRHELTIHHVNVQTVRAGLLRLGDLLSKPGKIR